MANPRQRRKSRSGSYKPVHHSRRAKKNLNKQPPIRAPKVVRDAWDRHKTVKQNYEALGLIASLNPTASGGVERPSNPPGTCQDARALLAREESTSQHVPATEAGVPKGYGRIVRDESGKVVDIVLPAEEDAAGADDAMEDLRDASRDERLAAWVEFGSDADAGNARDTRVIQALSRERGARAPRFCSAGELGMLRRLVSKYGEDTEAMSRDRRLNGEQRTAGELSRAIKKAGGVVRLGVERG